MLWRYKDTHFNDILNRTDVTDAQVERLLTMVSRGIQRQLRTPMSEKVKEYTISVKTTEVTLPTDFIETVSVYYKDRELRRVPMSQFRQLVQNTFEGSPEIYTRRKPKLQLHPQPTDGKIVLYYYGEFDAMTADSDENALAQAAPDLIIYAALTYSADFFLDERTQVFEAKYEPVPTGDPRTSERSRA